MSKKCCTHIDRHWCICYVSKTMSKIHTLMLQTPKQIRHGFAFWKGTLQSLRSTNAEWRTEAAMLAVTSLWLSTNARGYSKDAILRENSQLLARQFTAAGHGSTRRTDEILRLCFRAMPMILLPRRRHIDVFAVIRLSKKHPLIAFVHVTAWHAVHACFDELA